MKKLLICFIVLLCVCGCSTTSTSDAKLSQDKNTVFFKYDGKEYTTNDVFQKLKAQNAASYIDSLIATKANEIEGVSTDSLRESIEAEYDSMVEVYGEETVASYYGDKETVVEQALAANANTAYIMNYIKENIDTYASQYPTYYIQYVTSSDEKTMKKFVKNITKKKGFDEGFKATKFANEEIINEDVVDLEVTYLSTEVLEEVKSLQPGEVSDLITVVTEATDTTEETKTYYVVKLLSTDPKNDYEDLFTSYIMNKGLFTTATMLIRDKHTIEFFDDDFNFTYNSMIETYAPEETIESDSAE